MSKIFNILTGTALSFVVCQGVSAVKVDVFGKEQRPQTFEDVDNDDKILEQRKKEAKRLVEKAEAHIQRVGMEKGLRDLNDRNGSFCTKIGSHFHGVSVLTKGGKLRCSVKYPALVGKNVQDFSRPGGMRPAVQEIYAAQKNPSGSFIIGISNLNPYTSRPGAVTSYLKEVKGLIMVRQLSPESLYSV